LTGLEIFEIENFIELNNMSPDLIVLRVKSMRWGNLTTCQRLQRSHLGECHFQLNNITSHLIGADHAIGARPKQSCMGKYIW